MPNRLTASVHLEDIEKLQIYINSERKSLRSIKASTGADYILNGTLYNMSTWNVECHLKADGKVIAKPGYTVYGLAWDKGADLSMELLPCGRKNYIACTPLILRGGKNSPLIYDPGQGGKRGRSVIGIKNDALVLYCTKDGSSYARTPEALRDDLVKDGWTEAVMLDGGGSSQCDFAGKRVISSRVVQHLILVYLKKKKVTPANSPIGAAGLSLIKRFEGCRLKAYKPVSTEKYWTIGWGHYGPDVKQGQTITQAEADALLVQDCQKFADDVDNPSCCALTKQLNMNQRDALISFTYNCGAGCLKTLCQNRSLSQIAAALPLYNKSGGKVLAGLVRRRKAEQELFETPVQTAQKAETASAQSFDKSARNGVVYKVYGCSALNVRSSPEIKDGAASNVIRAIPNGTRVTWYGYYTGNWYLVKLPDGSTGYVSKGYLMR